MFVKSVHDVLENFTFHVSERREKGIFQLHHPATILAQDINRGGLLENGVSETKWTRGVTGAEKEVT